jgi:hypothetical protein
MVRRLVQPVTWDWLAREIAREIAARPYGTQRAKNFVRTLAERLKTGPAAKRGPKEKASRRTDHGRKDDASHSKPD